MEKNNFSLSIPLYVKQETESIVSDEKTAEEYYSEWEKTSLKMNSCLKELNEII